VELDYQYHMLRQVHLKTSAKPLLLNNVLHALILTLVLLLCLSRTGCRNTLLDGASSHGADAIHRNWK